METRERVQGDTGSVTEQAIEEDADGEKDAEAQSAED
jgi:hypothetical protein